MARYIAERSSEAILMFEVAEVGFNDVVTHWFVQPTGKPLESYNGDDRAARKRFNELSRRK